MKAPRSKTVVAAALCGPAVDAERHCIGVRRRATALWVVLALAAVGAPAFAAEPSSILDPDAVPWSQLDLTVHELVTSASIHVSYETVPTDQARLRWIAESGGEPLLPPGATTVTLESTTHLMGRSFDDQLWLCPGDGAAIQMVDLETGAKNHRRTYRFSHRGYTFDVRQPAGTDEQSGGPEQWTGHSVSFVPFPAQVPAGAVVSGPNALFYSAAAGGLPAVGGMAVYYVITNQQMERVTLTVSAATSVDVSFDVVGRSGSVPVKGALRVVPVTVSAEPIGASGTSSFKLFGLEGDIVILWDTERRVPVEVTGKVAILGRLTVRLAVVRLCDAGDTTP